MDWRMAMIERHKRDIKSLREGLEWMENGTFTSGEQTPNGHLVDLTKERMESYRRMIQDLEDAVARLEAPDA